jgi:hypothetical protein
MSGIHRFQESLCFSEDADDVNLLGDNITHNSVELSTT